MIKKDASSKGVLKVEKVGEIVSSYPMTLADGSAHPQAGKLILDNNNNPNRFRTVVFSVAEETDAQGRVVFSTAKPRSRNVWENSNPDLFNKLIPGAFVTGHIITAEVEPYTINPGTTNEREVSTITCIMFEDETEIQALSNTGMKRRTAGSNSIYNDPTKAPGQYPDGKDQHIAAEHFEKSNPTELGNK